MKRTSIIRGIPYWLLVFGTARGPQARAYLQKIAAARPEVGNKERRRRWRKRRRSVWHKCSTRSTLLQFQLDKPNFVAQVQNGLTLPQLQRENPNSVEQVHFRPPQLQRVHRRTRCFGPVLAKRYRRTLARFFPLALAASHCAQMSAQPTFACPTQPSAA